MLYRHTTTLIGFLAIASTVWSGPAAAEDVTFDAGALVVPMDTTYQDDGMLKAFGLVYALLTENVSVSWVVDPDKIQGEPDFSLVSMDVETATLLQSHDYRAGPFVVAAQDAAAARLIIDAWQDAHTTTVHEAMQPFTAFVNKRLVSAPTIGVFSDGNEDIAFGYLNAAGIPDSLGQPWPDRKEEDSIYPDHPDALNVADVSGPTTSSHLDGALFDQDGDPVYCQIMTMHWAVNDVVDEVVAEIRQFLTHPVHLFAQCQAVNALENNIHGHFLTPNGFEIDDRPDEVQVLNPTLAFAQFDGEFQTVGGSEPSYSLPDGDAYLDQDIVMLTAADSGRGIQDVWMTGFLDGACSINSSSGGNSFGQPGESGLCEAGAGKISYLGGHKYKTDLPISENPDTQGTRLFLNSLFEAECATSLGQPRLRTRKSGPALTTSAAVTWTMSTRNIGVTTALDVVVTDTLPAGATVVSATGNYTLVSETNSIVWPFGNLGPGELASHSVTVSLAEHGTYENTALGQFRVGVSLKSFESNTVMTVFDSDMDGDSCPDSVEAAQGTSTDTDDTDDDGATDCQDNCPVDFNPSQNINTDVNNCGTCGLVCDALQNRGVLCVGGACMPSSCLDGWSDLNGISDDGCEYACDAVSATDTTCDGADDDCNGVADEDYAPTSCGVGVCTVPATCTDGFETCVAGNPMVESYGVGTTCGDGLDNDCDGSLDAGDGDCDEPIVEPDTSDTVSDATSAGDTYSDETDAHGNSDADVESDPDAGPASDAADTQIADTDTQISDTGVEPDTQIADTEDDLDSRVADATEESEDTVLPDTIDANAQDSTTGPPPNSDTTLSDVGDEDIIELGPEGPPDALVEGAGCSCSAGRDQPDSSWIWLLSAVIWLAHRRTLVFFRSVR